MRKSFKLVVGVFGVVGLGAAAACSSSDGGTLGGSSGTEPDEAGTNDTGVTPPFDSGGGPIDSGADTGEPTDAGLDSGDARLDPSCTGLTYCENFESYTSGPLANNGTLGPWKVSTNGAAVVTVDGVHPYGGTKSLHITVPNADTGASALLNLTKAAGLIAGNNLWGRAMVYYGKTGTNDLPNGVHSWIFQGIGTSTASGKIMSLNLANGGTDYFLNYHGDSTSSAEASKTGGKPVAAAWVCMQWQYNSSGTPAADEAKVWADGTLVIDATKAAQNWNLATPFVTMQFGFTHYQTLKNSIDVYLDDYAVSDAMIPCP